MNGLFVLLGAAVLLPLLMWGLVGAGKAIGEANAERERMRRENEALKKMSDALANPADAGATSKNLRDGNF